MSFDLAALHLLRPHWLWALALLPLLGWLWRVRRRRASVWRNAVDAHLLPHLLAGRGDARLRWTAGLAMLAYVLAVVALAGPSWRQGAQPLWQSRTPLVIALDLSSATTASDLPPSRLAQARAKINALLQARDGGQVGLVAFAGDAFTVAPLTDDADNVAVFLDALAPDVMPVDGQRADRAIEAATQLLRQSGFDRGGILLMTDHADAQARDAAAKAARDGYRVSVLGLGSDTGAAYRRVDGSVGMARLDADSLRRLASVGGGRYAGIASGLYDLRALDVLSPDVDDAGQTTAQSGRQWLDEGYWLIPPLMLLALLAFHRRGGAVLVLLLCAGLPLQPARAVDWWQRPDQAEHAQLQAGTQAYRRGDFAAAAQSYLQADSADAHYNRGNALAKAGQYPQAVAAYDEALKRQPGMADALANKRAVEQAMKRPPSKDNGDAGQSSQGGDRNNSPGGKGQQGSKPPPESEPRKPSPESDASQPQPQQAKPGDAKSQQQADAAQRERMQRALQQAQPQSPSQQPQTAKQPANETPQQREKRLANEAWLRRVPDDPGGLLREKFRIEHERRQTQGRPDE